MDAFKLKQYSVHCLTFLLLKSGYLYRYHNKTYVAICLFTLNIINYTLNATVQFMLSLIIIIISAYYIN